MLTFSLVAVALLLCAAVFFFLQASERERQEEVNLRLRVLGGKEDVAVALAKMSAERQVSNPLIRWLCHLVWRTGTELQPSTVLRLLLAFVAIVPLILLAFGLLAGSLFVAIGLAAGWLFLQRKAARRRSQLIQQLPAFLESAIRVLAAGNTLEEALSSAAREAPDPIKPLFVSVGRQVRLGAPIETVLMESAEIYQLRDLKVMAMAASINRKFGGSMRNVLRSLVNGIRARESAARELRALTAETRFSALVLAAIPLLLMAYIVWRNPAYYVEMWAQLSGRILLLGALGLQVAGTAVIYRMMRSTGGDE